ncbi:MAG: hypothetical protein ACXVFT_01095 [Solirubrobacteraceae bacterium]
MTAGLVALSVLAGHQSQAATGVALMVFGLGFGLVGQVLMVAVQNAVDRRELGTATALTSFFRALGGSVGAATLGAVFAAHATGSADAVVGAVRAVWLVAAPVAALGLLVALRLPALKLRRS